MKQSDPNTPNRFLAPAPWDRKEVIELFAHRETIRMFLDQGWNAKMGQYCGLIHGSGETLGLLEASALFKGLLRPYNHETKESRLYVYVINSKVTYVYPESDRNVLAGWKQEPAPTGSVFTVIAEITEKGRPFSSGTFRDVPEGISGTVLDWEWTLADPLRPDLPRNFGGRYKEKVW